MSRTIMLLCSDWHIGRSHPSFNTTKAVSRIESIPETLKQHPCYQKPDAIAMLLLGDLIEGTQVYPSQQADGVHPAEEQIEETAQALRNLAKKLNKLAPLSIHAIRGGNHDKLRNAAHESHLDTAAIRRGLADQGYPLKIHSEDYAPVTIAGSRGVITHGHYRGPAHIETPAKRDVFLSHIRAHKADWLACGHKHHIGISEHNRAYYLRNGTLAVECRHALALGYYQHPTQLFAVIEDKELTGFGLLVLK